MPLKAGKSRATFSQNVSEMVKAGHPQMQALAASYRKARESGASFAAGGLTNYSRAPGSLAEGGPPINTKSYAKR